jgi:hypothetical protein
MKPTSRKYSSALDATKVRGRTLERDCGWDASALAEGETQAPDVLRIKRASKERCSFGAVGELIRVTTYFCDLSGSVV